MSKAYADPAKMRSFLVEMYTPKYRVRDARKLIATLLDCFLIGRELARVNCHPCDADVVFHGGSLTLECYRWHMSKTNEQLGYIWLLAFVHSFFWRHVRRYAKKNPKTRRPSLTRP